MVKLLKIGDAIYIDPRMKITAVYRHKRAETTYVVAYRENDKYVFESDWDVHKVAKLMHIEA
jgi:hypothetical protein